MTISMNRRMWMQALLFLAPFQDQATGFTTMPMPMMTDAFAVVVVGVSPLSSPLSSGLSRSATASSSSSSSSSRGSRLTSLQLQAMSPSNYDDNSDDDDDDDDDNNNNSNNDKKKKNLNSNSESGMEDFENARRSFERLMRLENHPDPSLSSRQPPPPPHQHPHHHSHPHSHPRPHHHDHDHSHDQPPPPHQHPHHHDQHHDQQQHEQRHATSFPPIMTANVARCRETELELLKTLADSDEAIDPMVELWVKEREDAAQALHSILMQRVASPGLAHEEALLRNMMDEYANSDWVEPHARLAALLFARAESMEDFDEILDLCHHVLQVKPWHLEMGYLLMIVWLRVGEFGRALQVARRWVLPPHCHPKRRHQWVTTMVGVAQERLQQAQHASAMATADHGAIQEEQQHHQHHHHNNNNGYFASPSSSSSSSWSQSSQANANAGAGFPWDNNMPPSSSSSNNNNNKGEDPSSSSWQ